MLGEACAGTTEACAMRVPATSDDLIDRTQTALYAVRHGLVACRDPTPTRPHIAQHSSL